MDWLWYLLLIATLLTGLFVNIVGLPGLWLMIGATGLYGWVTHWHYVGLWTLLILLILGLLAEIIEFLATGSGAKAVGGSRRAFWGGLVGGLIGAFAFSIPVPILGTIIGACLGAFIGATVMEFTKHGEVPLSFRVGVGAAKGRLWGIASKLAFGVIILILSLAMAFPLPSRRRLPPTTAPTTTPILSPHPTP